MKRNIDSELLKWKKRSRRKPLILRGARQVGKTYSLKTFGVSFDSLVIVDLEKNPALHKVFGGDLSASRLIADLEVMLGQKITPGKTLLFIDEIQSCPRAIIALRYFYEEMPDLHVVAAGSLLEFALQDISFPVGRIQFLHLRPLCFAEYLSAIGNEIAAEYVRAPPCQLSPGIHSALCDELRRYFFIGGMPESVKAFTDTGSLQESFEVQSEIIETYRLDFGKYAPRADKLCLNNVLISVARYVGQQIKYAKLAEGYSNPTLKKAFDLLCLARIIRKVPSADPSGLPLGASASAKIFKAILVDIGLFRHLSGMPVDVEYGKSQLLSIFRGAMAEQFVGQEMAVAQSESLHYWSRQAKSSSAEIDYLAIINNRIHPVEVKSGPAGRLKSLHLFLQTYKDCGSGLIFSDSIYAELPEQNIIFLPLYFAYSATHSIKRQSNDK
jgi:hypothetical protein